ncbi:MAG: sensor histidine kinase [Clostridiaceae bacterium]
MKNPIKTRSLGINLLIKIAFSILISLGIYSVVSYIFCLIYINNLKNLSILLINLICFGIFIAAIIVSIIIFLLLIRREIKYINYIKKQVKFIANRNLGATLEVRGQDELAELCESINYMSLELKRSFEKERELENTKNELITNISHDLRTPLTAIIGYLDILKNEKFDNKESEKEYLNSTYNLSIKLKKLIDALFEYTRLSNSEIKLNLDRVDINAVLNQLLGECTPVFERKGLKIIKDFSEKEQIIEVDIEKIIRVFDNILSNAEKYSYTCSDILIKVKNNNDHILFSFLNKSDPISKENLSKVFDRFYRVDVSRTNKIPGSGLGLAISKRIVELHHGRIWIECSEDTIKVNITLPINNI